LDLTGVPFLDFGTPIKCYLYMDKFSLAFFHMLSATLAGQGLRACRRLASHTFGMIIEPLWAKKKSCSADNVGV
jgi:hypothetical protein